MIIEISVIISNCSKKQYATLAQFNVFLLLEKHFLIKGDISNKTSNLDSEKLSIFFTKLAFSFTIAGGMSYDSGSSAIYHAIKGSLCLLLIMNLVISCFRV